MLDSPLRGAPCFGHFPGEGSAPLPSGSFSPHHQHLSVGALNRDGVIGALTQARYGSDAGRRILAEVAELDGSLTRPHCEGRTRNEPRGCHGAFREVPAV
ncbi:MAG TPA: hypothetical protein DCE44_21010 [Verrucomicrobiales bacterium]|nr:hypothetical protein [Verrucomicrobiales bacterium]